MIIGFAWASENHQSGLELIEQLRASAPPDEEQVAKYWLNVYGFWHEPAEDERLSAFARKAYILMQPFGEHGQYVNFLGAEIGQDIIDAVPGADRTIFTATAAFGAVVRSA